MQVCKTEKKLQSCKTEKLKKLQRREDYKINNSKYLYYIDIYLHSFLNINMFLFYFFLTLIKPQRTINCLKFYYYEYYYYNIIIIIVYIIKMEENR